MNEPSTTVELPYKEEVYAVIGNGSSSETHLAIAGGDTKFSGPAPVSPSPPLPFVRRAAPFV